MRKRKPFALKPGDSIGLVSPASPVLGEKQAALDKGVAYLESKGYRIVTGKHQNAKLGYLAGSDVQRVSDINDMFLNPEIKAIFCSRGGYGSPRILDAIDYTAVKRNPKWLVGYSDITALQFALYKKAGLVSLSGPMVAIDMNPEIHYLTEHTFWDTLTGSIASERSFPELGDEVSVLKKGIARGRLLGGCLSIVCSMLGTSYAPKFKNTILFLEDVGEDLYKIDRLFAQLKLSGVLYQIKGLLLGQFVNCNDNISETPVQLNEIFEYYTKDLTIPVINNIYYGHGPVKISIPLGVYAELNTFNQKLKYMESVVNE